MPLCPARAKGNSYSPQTSWIMIILQSMVVRLVEQTESGRFDIRANKQFAIVSFSLITEGRSMNVRILKSVGLVRCWQLRLWCQLP